jgi:hypothetical protein
LIRYSAWTRYFVILFPLTGFLSLRFSLSFYKDFCGVKDDWFYFELDEYTRFFVIIFFLIIINLNFIPIELLFSKFKLKSKQS